MKALTVDEVQAQKINPASKRGRGPSMDPASIELRQIADKIAVGEAVIVMKDEWKLKSTPATLLQGKNRHNQTHKVFSAQTLEGKTGWLIKRVR